MKDLDCSTLMTIRIIQFLVESELSFIKNISGILDRSVPSRKKFESQKTEIKKK